MSCTHSNTACVVCGLVLVQCRCMSPNKVVRYVTCSRCKKQGSPKKKRHSPFWKLYEHLRLQHGITSKVLAGMTDMKDLDALHAAQHRGSRVLSTRELHQDALKER